ncbi:arsenite methyltransferase [Actinophytocola sp.]|uniref:arsenite methyltransferase n=1 Tax=Actinophytocola sp. TaxID=1872138 RepID=UPI002D80280B|nr:arsenite methyltransferase [Actinophytocola sp.]HET9138374.1 arsenite methyltransferase [Actinophytocola sp.]
MATDQVDPAAVREQVRARYAAVAVSVLADQPTGRCGPSDAAGVPAQCCHESEGEEWAGARRYAEADRAVLPDGAVAASLGCGNPLLVADLHVGETVLDLGSGGGIDVLLSARRVGPTGKAYGLDMAEEMLELARRNAAEARATNVEFLRGHMEDIPLPAGSVDVVISNCVINLSVDKPAVFASMHRVLRPGGRIGISDVVAEDRLSAEQRAERGGWVGCIAGALSVTEYRQGLTDAGFTDVDITFTQQAADGIHSAIVRAAKPSS